MRNDFTLRACSDFQAQRLADASSAWTTGVTENRVRMTSCLEGGRNGTGVCEGFVATEMQFGIVVARHTLRGAGQDGKFDENSR